MHEQFYQNIEPDYAGRYRNTRVIITGSRYLTTAPEKLDGEMERLLEVPFPELLEESRGNGKEDLIKTKIKAQPGPSMIRHRNAFTWKMKLF